MSISSNVSVVLEGGSLHDVQKGRAPGYRLQVQDTDRSFFCSLSIWRFWEKRGKMEVKMGESWRRETPSFLFPLSPSPLGRPDTQASFFFTKSLSPSQRPLFVVGSLGRTKKKRKRAGEDGKSPPPPTPSRLIIAIFIGIPSGILCGGESLNQAFLYSDTRKKWNFAFSKLVL